jgi:hypothetical protein
MDIQTHGEEEADCDGDQLFVGVGILPYQRFLGEKNFRSIDSRCRASEDVVAGFKG